MLIYLIEIDNLVLYLYFHHFQDEKNLICLLKCLTLIQSIAYHISALYHSRMSKFVKKIKKVYSPIYKWMKYRYSKFNFYYSFFHRTIYFKKHIKYLFGNNKVKRNMQFIKYPV